MARHAATVCFESDLGHIEVAAGAGGVTQVRLAVRGRVREVGDGTALAVAREARDQIIAYLAGARNGFTVATAPAGTEFQRAVWRELRAIPYGETTTYGAIAARLGRRRGARAVGAACGANPLPLIIPCHRVVSSQGELVGFRGGVGIKRRLLELESGAVGPRAAE